MLHLHASRRIQHLLTGIIILAVSYIIPPYPAGFVSLVLTTLAFYQLHHKRTKDRDYDNWYLERFGGLLREDERGEWMLIQGENDRGGNHNKKYIRKSRPELPGAFYFLLGTALSSAIFPERIARTALLVLSVSDPFAGFIGVWFSKHHWNTSWTQLLEMVKHEGGDTNIKGNGPTIAGSVACALSTLLCTYVYFPNSLAVDASDSTLMIPSRVIISVVTAIVEAGAGRCRILPIDDNLLIPLVVGGLISWLADK
ncbi:hypothetical protein HJC23_008087 [Cyclotella cryptica]|uniref:Phosphatidate cytidylyltransferase n=1 Tax=Cyclotella cryptica TaxID=29204 RepID=A0ABD3PGH4_9STRA